MKKITFFNQNSKFSHLKRPLAGRILHLNGMLNGLTSRGLNPGVNVARILHQILDICRLVIFDAIFVIIEATRVHFAKHVGVVVCKATYVGSEGAKNVVFSEETVDTWVV